MNTKGIVRRGLLTTVMLLLMVSTASAVHDIGVFELDRNPQSGAAAGDDWDVTLFGSGGASLVTTGVIEDDLAGDQIFTTGGSKDNGDVSGWQCTAGSVPDKDEITNAYAAIYAGPTGPVFYFGLDRFAQNGDAQVGFWLLQDSVSCPAAGGNFVGNHQVGDLLVLSDFTNGGVVSNIKVFEWVGVGGSDGPLDLVATGNDCVPGAAGDDVCATVNTAGVLAPWPYTPKSGPAGTIPTGGFYEGGLDLSAFFPNGIGCFSDFLAETRSSQSLGSQLKDFALGSFNTCEITVDKTGPALSKVGDDVTYTITITNTGITTLFLDSIDDSKAGDITGDAPASCDELIPGEVCQFTYDYTVVQSDPDPLLNTVTVHYNENAQATGDDVSGSDGHSVNLFQPSVQVVKNASPNSGQIGDNISYDFTITNTGSADSPALILDSASDTVLGDIADDAPAACDSLAVGASCNFQVVRALQAGDPDPLNNVVTVHYHPSGFPNDITDTDSDSVDIFTTGVTVVKGGDTLSKIGDQVTYTFQITNTGSAGGPAILLDSVSDTLLGNLTANATAASCGSLAVGASCNFSVNRTVQAGDPDPLPNTVTVHYHVAGSATDINDSDDHSVNLFQPSVEVIKTGDTVATVGTLVNYHFVINNTSSGDSPNLVLDSVTDNVIGSLTAAATGASCANLAPGGSCNFNASRTVLAGDPDPLVNVVTVHYHPSGFPNDITDTDDHSVDLFQASVTIDKTGDELSKVGDDVTYHFVVTNTSSAGTPPLVLDSISDTVLGNLAAQAGAASCDPLALGASCNFDVVRTVVAGDPDPLPNTVTVHYHPTGFASVDASASDNHSVNLFQPSVQVVKGGPATATVGQLVTYTFQITNTSSADSPNLIIDSVSDTLLGPLSAPAACNSLAPAASCNFTADRTVLATDPDPLPNTVTVHYHPDGFPNDITDSDDHSINLFQLSVTIDKTGDTLSKIGDEVNYTITTTNTSSVDSPNLDCTITDPLLGINKSVNLAPGANDVIHQPFTIPAGSPDPLPNTASVSCTAAGVAGSVSASDDHSVNLFQPSITLDKTGDDLSKIGDPVDYTITLANNSSSDSPDLVCTVTDAMLGINKQVTLASGGVDVTNATRTVLASDPDPLVNTASASCSPVGFPNVLTASDSHTVNLFQPSVAIDKTGPPFSKAGDTAEYVITVTNTSSADTPVLECNLSDPMLGLNENFGFVAGQQVIRNGSHLVTAGDPDPLVNTATVVCSPAGFPNVIGANDSHTVDLLHPSFTVDKSCLAGAPVPPGASANFRIDIVNTGDVDLIIDVTDTVLSINQVDVTLGHTAGGVCSEANLDSDPSDGCYRIEAGVIAGTEDIHNEVSVHATLPEFTQLPNELNGSDDATCEVEQGGATRTQGFWATHDIYTCHIFTTHLGGSINLGWAQLDSCADVFGVFWANNAKTLTGQKRTPICQARMIASQQALAAILNTGLTNGAPLPGGLTLAQIAAILGGNNRNAILALSAQLDIYNQSGDPVAIVDGDGFLIPNADPKAAKAAATGATLPGALCPL